MPEETYRVTVSVAQVLDVLVEASSPEEAEELANDGVYVLEDVVCETISDARDVKLDVIPDAALTNRQKVDKMFALLSDKNLVTALAVLSNASEANFFLMKRAKAGEKSGIAYYTGVQARRAQYGETDAIFVSFAATAPGPVADCEIGELVTDAATEVGLECIWTGDRDDCVEICVPGGFRQ